MSEENKIADAEIVRIAKGFTKGILNGKSTVDMCYMVCSPLVSYLCFCGIECTLTEGELQDSYHHFWITLSDGRIIDPTADQFGLLNIWVRKQPSYYKVLTEEPKSKRSVATNDAQRLNA